MRLKKTLAKTLVFAMAVSFMPMSAHVAKANDVKPEATKVVFSGATGEITIKSDEQNAKFWGIAKVLKSEKGANFEDNGTHYKILDIEPVVEKTIDLSSFGKNKDIVIGIGSKETVSKGTWILKTVKAEDKTKVLKVGYTTDRTKFGKLEAKHAFGSADYGYLVAYEGKNGEKEINIAEADDTLEIRQGDGSWTTIKKYFGETPADKVEEKLKMLTRKGSSLSFRTKGTDTLWKGNEAKVKIPAQTKGPALKVDAIKETTSIKPGVQYKLQEAQEQGGYKAAQWSDLSEGEKKGTFKLLTIDPTKSYLLSARNKATATKIASKATAVVLKKQDAPTIKDSYSENKALENQGADLIENAVSLALKVKYDVKKGAELTNASKTEEFEVFIDNDGQETDGEVKTWMKLKPTKNPKKPTKITLKYGEGKNNTFKENSMLYIRVAGKKQVGNEVMMASKEKKIKLSLTKLAQTMQVAVGSNVEASPTNKTATIKVSPKKESTHTLKFTMQNRDSKKANIKVKVTQAVPGVSVKVDKFNASHMATVTVKVSKNAFKEDVTATTLKFKYTVESIDEEFTLSIAKKQ